MLTWEDEGLGIHSTTCLFHAIGRTGRHVHDKVMIFRRHTTTLGIRHVVWDVEVLRAGDEEGVRVVQRATYWSLARAKRAAGRFVLRDRKRYSDRATGS